MAKAPKTPTDDTSEYIPDGPMPKLLKKNYLYGEVVLMTGMRKQDVREVVDATFEVIRNALHAGQDVQCTPMGKLRVINKETADGPKTIYKLNLQPKPAQDDPFAAIPDEADV